MLESLTDFWNQTMQIPEARWIVWGTLLLFAVMIAVYVSFFFRNLAIGESGEEADDLLTEFRNMRDTGQIKADEFSALKTKIPTSGYDPVTRSVENGEEREDNRREKKFLTLAEAQQRKKELEQLGESEGNDQANEDA